MNPGQSRTINLAFRVSDTAQCSASISNTASVQADGVTVVQSNSAQSQVACNPANLMVVKSTPQSTVTAGGTLFYSIEVTNNGQSAAQNVVVTDQIPNGLAYQAQTSDGRCSLQGSSLTCNVGTVTAGGKTTIALNFQVSAQAQCNSTIYNTASATAAGIAPVTSNQVQTQVACNPANLSISKTVAESTVQRGGTVHYTIVVTNNGQSAAQNVLVTDVVPSGLSYQSNDAGCTSYAATMTCNVGTLNAGESRTIHITFTVDSGAACSANIVNTASVQATGVNPIQSNQVQTQVQCPQNPTFSITKTDNRTTVAPGETLNYQIVVTNTSTVVANNVVVTDTLPSQLTYVSASDSPSVSGNALTWTIPSIAANSSKTITVNATVSAATSNGTQINNTASVAGQTATDTTTVQVANQTGCVSILKEAYDPNNTRLSTVAQFTFKLDNNQTVMNDAAGNAQFTNVPVGSHTISEVVPNGWTQFNVTPENGIVNVSAGGACAGVTFKNRQVVSGGGLSITKTDNRTTAAPGEVLTYQITVTNSASTAATNVTVTDTLPSQLTYQSASDAGSINGQTITWTNLTVNANSSKTLTISARIADTTSNGTSVVNTAQIQNGPSAQDTTTVQTGSTGNPCTVSVSHTPNDPRANDTVSYMVRVTNVNSVSTPANVTMILPSRVRFANADNGGYNNNGVVTWGNVILSGNETRYFTVNARLDSDIQSDDILRSTVSACNTSIEDTLRLLDDYGDLDLSIDITDNPDPVRAGQLLKYRIRVSNDSDRDLRNGTLVVTMDDNTEFDDASDNGDERGSSRVEWTGVDIDRDDEEEFTLTVRVNDDVEDGDTLHLRARIEDASATEDTDVVAAEQESSSVMSGNLTFDKRADRYEAQPGDHVTYTITIRNGTSEAVTGVQVSDLFDANKVAMSNIDSGSMSNGSIVWDIGSVGPGETRIIRYTGTLSSSLRHGDSVQNTATMASDKGQMGGSATVRIIQHLPQTGAGDNTGPLDDGSQFLRPISAAQEGSALPLTIWSVMLSGIGTMGYFGKRLFI